MSKEVYQWTLLAIFTAQLVVNGYVAWHLWLRDWHNWTFRPWLSDVAYWIKERRR